MCHSSAVARCRLGGRAAEPKDTFESWLVGELLLVALLGSATALFLTNPALRNTYELPEGGSCSTPPSCSRRRSSPSSPASASSVEGRVLDLLLAAGFFVAGVGTLAFSVVPVLGGANQDAPGGLGRDRRTRARRRR